MAKKKIEKSSLTRTQQFFPIIALIVASLCLVFSAEAARIACLDGLSAVPGGLSSIVTGAWVTDCLVLTLSILFFWALTNRLSAGILLSASLTGVLLFAHVQKTRAIGKPLAMSDLSLVSDVLSVIGGVLRANLGAFIGLGVGLVVVGIVFFQVMRKTPKYPVGLNGRLILIGTVGLFFTFFLEPPKRLFVHVIKDERENGFLCNFLRSPWDKFRQPAGYSEESIQKRAPSVDVVFYIGESFFDTERLANVNFDVDPMPNYHDAVQKSLSRKLISPEIGGVTANVEFEVMTGIPLATMPVKTVPYIHTLKREIEAIAWIFRDNNYSTRAVHNFYKEMFFYEHNYPRIGFEDFSDLSRISIKSFMGDRRLRLDRRLNQHVLLDGPFPSDEPLAHDLIERLNSAESPVFLFGLGMVSHGGYDGWPEDQKTVRIVSEGLSPSTKESLEHLANALNRADIALGYLIRAVESRARPTVLFFMGDHLPYISDLVLREGGFDFGDNGQRRYEVPFFVLANFPLPELDIPDRMSAFYLPSKILRAAGIDGGPYFRFLESKLNQITAMNHNFLLLPDGREFTGPRDPNLPPDVAQMVHQTLEDFSLLAWDRLEGEGYSFRSK